MYVMFLDESGDHSLDRIDPQFPVFVLAGCIFAKEYHDATATIHMSAFKHELFGRADIILHTADITRNRHGFERIKDASFRNDFYSATNTLIAGLEFTVLACAIHKARLVDRYGHLASDPYALSLEKVIERFVFFLHEVRSHGEIVAESRGPILDRDLDLVFHSLLTRGTRHLRPRRLAERITALSFRPKQQNIAGLQVADLAATPIARAIVDKNKKEDYRLIEKKFRQRGGSYIDAGLVVIPK